MSDPVVKVERIKGNCIATKRPVTTRFRRVRLDGATVAYYSDLGRTLSFIEDLSEDEMASVIRQVNSIMDTNGGVHSHGKIPDIDTEKPEDEDYGDF